jgi:hypothetical protein
VVALRSRSVGSASLLELLFGQSGSAVGFRSVCVWRLLVRFFREPGEMLLRRWVSGLDVGAMVLACWGYQAV